MPPTVLNRAQSREVDRRAVDEFHVPSCVLMENAGRGCAELLLQQPNVRSALICCGKGNNGGDGFVIARHLAIHGIDAHILLLAEPEQLRGDAAINYDIASRFNIPMTALPSHLSPHEVQRGVLEAAKKVDWLVDALLGTGAQGPVSDVFAAAITSMNNSGRPIIAVDLPSGLDCDTGAVLGTAIKATITATLVAEKPCMQIPTAIHHLGKVHVLHIGIPNFTADSTHI